MHRRSRRVAQYLAARGVVAGLGMVANAQQPDFTGVWTTYTEPAQGRAGGAGGGGGRGAGPALPLTADAQRKIAEYQARIKGTGDTPGG